MKQKVIAVQLSCRVNDVKDLVACAKEAVKMIKGGAKIGFADGSGGAGFNFKTTTPEQYKTNGFK